MGKTSKRVISLVLSVLMVLSMVSVFCLPTMAASKIDAENIDYDAVRTDAYIINGAWTEADLVADAEVSYYYRGQTYKETYDAARHFSSFDAAYEAYIATNPDIIKDVPVFIFAPGTYSEKIQVRFSGLILGANAGINPNASVDNWTLDGMKDGWAANEAWDASNETVFTGGVARATRLNANGGCPANDAAENRWAYMLEDAEAKASASVEFDFTVDGVKFTGKGGDNSSLHVQLQDYDVGVSVTDGAGGTYVTKSGRNAYTNIQNSVLTDSSSVFLNSQDLAANKDTVVLKNMRVTNYSGYFFKKYLEDVTVDGLYFAESSGRVFGYNENDSAFGAGGGASAEYDQKVVMKNSMIYRNTQPYPITIGNKASHGSFTKQEFSFDNNIFYDAVVGATWGAYGIFCFYNQNPNYTFNVSITNNQFHQSTFVENTFINMNYAYNLSPMYLTIKENIITGSCGALYPNLGDFETNAPGYISASLNWDIADNYQAAAFGDTGIAPAFESENQVNGAPFANGFDPFNTSYYYDAAKTVKNTDLAITEVAGLGESVNISGSTVLANCGGMSGKVTPVFTLSSADAAAAVYSDSTFETPVTEIDLDAIEDRQVFYVRVTKGGYTRDYTLDVSTAVAVEFADALADGSLGEEFTMQNTVAYVPGLENGQSVSAYWNGEYYNFTADTLTVYGNMNDLTTDSDVFEDLKVVMPVGEYGAFTVSFAADFYGANYMVDPVDKADKALGSAWDLSSAWGTLGETVVGAVNIADNVEGKVSLQGFTFSNVLNDTKRTTQSGNLDLTVKNSVFDFKGASGGQNYTISLENPRTTSGDASWAANYADTFTLENIYFKDIGSDGNRRFLGEGNPTKTHIKNVFWNGALGGTSSVFGWVKNKGKVSSVDLIVEDSQFRDIQAGAFFQLEPQAATGYKATFRNNQFVNSVDTTAATTFISINADIDRFSGLVIDNNTFMNLGGMATAIGSNNADIIHALGESSAMTADAVSFANNNFINCINDTFAVGVIKKLENSFFTKTADYASSLTGSSTGAEAQEYYWLDFERTVKNTDFDIQAMEAGTTAIENIALNNLERTISFTMSSGSTDGMVITLPDGITGKWYNSDMSQELESISSEDFVGEADYLYVVTNGEKNRIYSVHIIGYTPDSFADTYEQPDGLISSSALMVTPKAANAVTGTPVTERWDNTLYLFNVGVNAFATIDDAIAYAAANEIDVPEILIPSWDSTKDITISRAAKVFAPNYNTKPYVDDGYGLDSESRGEAWAENQDYFDNQIIVKNIVVGSGVSGTAEFYGFTFTEYVKDTGRLASEVSTKVKLANIVRESTLNGYSFQVGNANCYNVDNTDELYVLNFYARSGGKDSRLIGEQTPSKVTFDGMYIDAEQANFTYPAYIKSSANTWIFTIKNSNLRTWHNLGGSANGPLQFEGDKEDANGRNRQLIYQNNILHEYGNQTGAGGKGPWYMIRWFANTFSGFTFENNYVDAGLNTFATNENDKHTMNFFHTDGVTKDNYDKIQGDINIKGNIFNGVRTVLVVDGENMGAQFTFNVENNFGVHVRTDDLDNAIGVAPYVNGKHLNQNIGNFWLDAAMTKPSNVIYDMTFANDGKYMSNGATKVLKYKLDAEDANVTVTPVESEEGTTYNYSVNMGGFITENLYNNIVTISYGDASTKIDKALSFTLAEQPEELELKVTVASPDGKTSEDYRLLIAEEFNDAGIENITVGDVNAAYDAASGKYSVTLPADGSAEAITVTPSTGATAAVTDAEGAPVTNVDVTCEAAVEYTIKVTNTSADAEETYTLTVSREHSWNAGEETKAPTCSEVGTMTYTCSVCQQTKTEDIAINPEAHDWNEGVVTTPATCTTEGVKTYTCNHNPEHTKTASVAVDPEAHDWDDGVVTKAPTCQTEGVKTYTCKHNGEHTKTDTIPVDPDAHVWDEGTVTTEPTCTKDGEKTVSCTVEGCNVEGQKIPVPKLGHQWDEGTVTTPATCTTEGVKTFTCTRENCDHIDDTKTEPVAIDPDAHEWDEESGVTTKAPTCSAAGEETFSCKYNPDHKDVRTVEIDPNAHDWDDGTVTKEPTCTTKGEMTYTCKNNPEHTRKEDIDVVADNHVWDDGVVTTPATCEADGVMTYTCTECSETKTEVIAKLGHAWDEGVVTKEATCSAEGEKLFTCKNDETHTRTEVIAINPDAHKWGEYVYNNDATEEADGTETRKCEYCGKEETRTAEGTKLEPEHPPVDSAEIFPDIEEGRWYKEYIDYVAQYGLMNGNADGTFAPNGKLNRAQFVQILANLSGVDTSNRDVETTFEDVPANKWYTPAVKWASENGIVDGMEPGKFMPLMDIQRQQICVMIVRYAEHAGITLDAKVDEMTFADAASIKNYAKDAVVICQRAGIIDGMDGKDGTKIFAPADTATRAQVATMMTRFHENFVNVK